MIEAVNISKSYGKKEILKKVSIQISLDEITGLLGPNGAGKTTLFYILAGLTNSDSGKVIFNNRKINSLSLSSRAEEGLVYLPQEPSIFRNLSVEENIKSSLETKTSSKKELNSRIIEIMENGRRPSAAGHFNVFFVAGKFRFVVNPFLFITGFASRLIILRS